MSSSSSHQDAGPSVPPIASTTQFSDVSEPLAKMARNSSQSTHESAASAAFDDMLEEIILGISFDIHRAAKTGQLTLSGALENLPSSSQTSLTPGVDVFGQVITTSTGVPPLKKQLECVCPNCQRNLAAVRFAPHLEKCMGMGRNSSRVASRRILAANNGKDKDSSKDKGGNDKTGGSYNEQDDDDDDDWIEPVKSTSHRRRQRDKNSPKRNKGRGRNGGSGDGLHDGTVTPPSNFDQLSLEERSQWLTTICGVVSLSSRKVCTRSTKCPVHSEAQKREVRLRWLNPAASVNVHLPDEETHVDIDSFTEGDTVALRESLAQLSGASSPADSTISTSSNLSASNQSRSYRGTSREPASATSTTATTSSSHKKGYKGKSGRGGGGSSRGGSKSGSKSASRGSTPPITMLID